MRSVLAAISSALVVSASLAIATPTVACSPGVFHPTQEAVLLYHDGVEVLVWRTSLEAPPPDPGAPAAPRASRDVAWLLAVPTAPLAYAVAPSESFQRAVDWSMRQVASSGGRGGDGEGGTGHGIGGLSVGTTVRVGDYRVTPLRGTGANAVTALTRWLRSRHIPLPSREALARYAQEGATFLAITARRPAAARRAELRPIAIAFRTPRPIVPIRLSHGEPTFALSVVAFSTAMPNFDRALGHGLQAEDMLGVGTLTQPRVQGPRPITIVPSVSFPSWARELVAPVERSLPAFDRLLNGSVAMSVITGAVTVDPTLPDPSFAVGDAIPADARGALHSPSGRSLATF